MTDDSDPGHPQTTEASAPPVDSSPEVVPTTLVFDQLSTLADSLGAAPATGPGPVTPAPGPVPSGVGSLPPARPPAAVPGQARTEVVTDEERTRFGHLLDSAAERGLLDPAEYEIRLRELAEATTTAQMVEIVTELPVFAAPPVTTTRSRRSPASSGRPTAGATGQRRRTTVWVVLAVVIVVTVGSLVILALSVDRLSRTRHSGQPPAPMATRPVSALRL